MTAFTSRGGLDPLPRRPYDASKPTLVEMYAHKPLPPLPLNLHSNRPAEPASQPLALQKPSKAPNPEASLPRHVPALRSFRTHSRRRSSYKVQQLTGYDIGIADDSPSDSECSSIHSPDWADCSYNLVPLLEADDGDASSGRGSSWEPTSPFSVSWPSPPNAAKPVIRSGSDASLASPLVRSEARRALGEEWMRRWDPSYGQFSDSKVSGEYHRIASEIAARHTSISTGESLVPVAATEARSKRPSLSVNLGSGVTFSARRRNASHPVNIFLADRQVSGVEIALPATPPPPQLTPMSAFDCDSSDGEARAAGRRGRRGAARYASGLDGGATRWEGRQTDRACTCTRRACGRPRPGTRSGNCCTTPKTGRGCCICRERSGGGRIGGDTYGRFHADVFHWSSGHLFIWFVSNIILLRSISSEACSRHALRHSDGGIERTVRDETENETCLLGMAFTTLPYFHDPSRQKESRG